MSPQQRLTSIPEHTTDMERCSNTGAELRMGTETSSAINDKIDSELVIRSDMAKEPDVYDETTGEPKILEDRKGQIIYRRRRRNLT